VDQVVFAVLAVACAGELGIVIATVLARWLFQVDLVWEQELSDLALSVIAFVGGAAAYGRGLHVSLRVLVGRLPSRVQARLAEFDEAFVIAMGVALAASSIPVLTSDWNQSTEFLHIKLTWIDLPYTAGMILFAYYAVRKLTLRKLTKSAVVTVTVTCLAALVLAVAIGVWGGPFRTSTAVPISLIVLVVLLLAGVPIGVVLASASALAVGMANVAGPTIVPGQMKDLTTNFIYLAIPFFVIAGLYMASARITKYLTAFVNGLIGRVPGGLLHVMVCCMYIFSGMSGSKAADMVAVGSSMDGMLDEAGYDKGEAAAVLSASAVMGETIPPSLVLLILGSVTSLSIETLFAAGILPAAVLALCLAVAVYIRARARRTQRNQDGAREVLLNLARCLPAVVLPVILVGGIITGIGTPTEVSAFAVVFGLLLVGAVYRVNGRVLWSTTCQALAMSGMILFILSAAQPFGWLLTINMVPQTVANWAIAIGAAHWWLFMFLLIVIMVVFGALLEGAAAVIVLAPILIPAAQGIGLNPIVSGLVLVIALGIGTQLPLIGLGSYISSTTLRVRVEDAARPAAGYLAMVAAGLVLVAFVPAISLWIPRLLGLGS
jgi:tripartite ATP-independent transporter DctM subunit